MCVSGVGQVSILGHWDSHMFTARGGGWCVGISRNLIQYVSGVVEAHMVEAFGLYSGWLKEFGFKETKTQSNTHTFPLNCSIMVHGDCLSCRTLVILVVEILPSFECNGIRLGKSCVAQSGSKSFDKTFS